MYYEVYIDILFLNNVCLNYIVLEAVRKTTQSAVKHRRIVLSSIAGSAASCVVLLLLHIPFPLRLLLVYGVVNIGMLQMAMHMKKENLWQTILLFYTFSFFVGGFVEWLSDTPFFMGTGVTSTTGLLVICVVGGVLLQGIVKLFMTWQKKNNCFYEVKIELGEIKINVTGLLDTGNSLLEPISGKPVSILESEAAKELLQNADEKNFRYIPFRSLGKEHGALQGILVTRITIESERDRVVMEQPMIGIYEGKISGKNRYQMIIHPALLGL